MAQEKPGWDTRTWLVGLVGGIVAGGMFVGSAYPPTEAALGGDAYIVSVTSLVIGAFVLPGVVSAIAKKWHFLWGIVPLIPLVIIVDAFNGATQGLEFVAQGIWTSLSYVSAGFVLSSGIVSLVRLSRARRKPLPPPPDLGRTQKGVWPPPPDYRQEIKPCHEWHG